MKKILASKIEIFISLAVLSLANMQLFKYPLIGDDLVAFQTAYARAAGDPFVAAAQSWNAGVSAGHFNPVGQLIGGMFHFYARAICSQLNLGPSFFYAIVNFALVVGALWQGSRIIRTALNAKLVGQKFMQISTTRAFTLLSATYGLLLQFHPWSNDPVTSYPLAGAGSAFVILATVSMLLRITSQAKSDSMQLVFLSLAMVLAIYFYEMALVLIPFSTSLIFIYRKKIKDTSQGLALVMLTVAVPTIAFALGRAWVFLSNQQNSYDGTQPNIGIEAFVTFLTYATSISPVATWPVLLSTPGLMTITITSLLTAAIWAVALILMAKFYPIQEISQRPDSRQIGVAISIFGLALCALATHAFTGKYSKEISGFGKVYLSYSLALILFSIFLVLMYVWFGNKLGDLGGKLLLAFVVALCLVQTVANNAAFSISTSNFSINELISKASVDIRSPEKVNCSLLSSWLDKDWPSYYEEALVVGIDFNYRHMFSKAFCSESVVQGK